MAQAILVIGAACVLGFTAVKSIGSSLMLDPCQPEVASIGARPPACQTTQGR